MGQSWCCAARAATSPASLATQLDVVHFLMWEMPYHAEHHRYPALPFFALAEAHRSVGPHLLQVARRGYLGVHAEFLKQLAKKAVPERAA